MRKPFNSPNSARLWVMLLCAACTISICVVFDSESASLYLSALMEPSESDEERMIATYTLDREQGYRLLTQITKFGRLDFRRVSRYSLPDECPTPMEKEILSDGPAVDLSTIPVAETSTVTLLADPPRGRAKGMVGPGGRVEVRVDLKDEEGRLVGRGGHSVRVWLEQRAAEGRPCRAMAADVTDMRNGSYTASLPVLWSGQMEVKAALERPREFRHVMLRLMEKMKMTNQNPAAFSFQETEQITLCSFVPVIPGFAEVCNLTELNSGLPWYCGKPTKDGLRCDHWAWSKHTAFPQWYPASLAENELMKRFTGKKAKPLHVLPNPIAFYGLKDAEPRSEVNKSCSPQQPRASWNDQSPRGFWENGSWTPLIGCPLPSLNSAYIRRCFCNTRLLFLGDSNAALLYLIFEKLLECKRAPDPQKLYHLKTGHVPMHSSSVGDVQQNITMAWYPHAYPFFSGANFWSDVRVKRAPGAVLRDELEATAEGAPPQKYVVLIHLFIHYSPVHSYIYSQHVRHTASAVRDFLARNPDARVFVRGPHAVLGKDFRLTGDLHAMRCLDILRREFLDLQDRVVLLNAWDMTVANRNEDVHPDDVVTETLAAMMSAHACPQHAGS